MKKNIKTTQKTLQALLSGTHPSVNKYAGQQVFVVDKEVVPLKKGKRGLEDFKKLKEKHKQSPTLVFVPKPGATYILIMR